MSFQEFQSQAVHFLETLFKKMRHQGVVLEPHWDIDHLCYRFSSRQNYDKLKFEFLSFGELLIESEVNGRPISTFKLKNPILYHEYRVDVVELPAPKPNKIVKEGFEHIEVVCDRSFNELRNLWPTVRADDSG